MIFIDNLLDLLTTNTFCICLHFLAIFTGTPENQGMGQFVLSKLCGLVTTIPDKKRKDYMTCGMKKSLSPEVTVAILVYLQQGKFQQFILCGTPTWLFHLLFLVSVGVV